MGKSEDFFYIKVSQKARGSHRPDYTALSSGDQAGVDFDPSTPPKLMPFPNQLEMVSWGLWQGCLDRKGGEEGGKGASGEGGLSDQEARTAALREEVFNYTAEIKGGT
jgi:hypothetical protein